MFLSIINKNGFWLDAEEMLIPKVIGKENIGYGSFSRLDKRLPVGLDPMTIIFNI